LKLEKEEADYVATLFPEVEDIKQTNLRQKVIEAWIRGWRYGGWKLIEDIPYAPEIPKISNVEHTRAATRLAAEIARILKKDYNPDVNLDFVIAGALLHDVGKTLEYVDCAKEHIVKGPKAGRLIPHSISGVYLAMEVGVPLEVVLIIPHVIGETLVKTLEANIVKYANNLIADAVMKKELGIMQDEYVKKFMKL